MTEDKRPAGQAASEAILASRNDRVGPGFGYKLLPGSNSNIYGMDVVFPEEVRANESQMSIVIPFADGSSRDGVGDVTDIGGIGLERHILGDCESSFAVSIPLLESSSTHNCSDSGLFLFVSFANESIIDNGSASVVSPSQLFYTLTTNVIQMNLSDDFLIENSVGHLTSRLFPSVVDLISLIFFVSSPFEVIKPVISRISVKMTADHAIGARLNEYVENKMMDTVALGNAMISKVDDCISIPIVDWLNDCAFQESSIRLSDYHFYSVNDFSLAGMISISISGTNSSKSRDLIHSIVFGNVLPDFNEAVNSGFVKDAESCRIARHGTCSSKACAMKIERMLYSSDSIHSNKPSVKNKGNFQWN